MSTEVNTPQETPNEADRKALLRGRAVERFSALESSLDGLIASYYTPRQPLSTYFHLDLLASEGFSFGLRRSVFESITRRHDMFDGKRMNHLHGAGRWRNFLAHAVVETHYYEGDDPEPKKIAIRDAKYPHKPFTLEEAFANFSVECEKAIAYVRDVSAKCFPMAPSCVSGHIVEAPDPPWPLKSWGWPEWPEREGEASPTDEPPNEETTTKK